MKILKYAFFSLSLMISTMMSAKGFQDETLKYVIGYKWGLIHKDAGDATLSLSNKGDVYQLRLTGRTKSWADNFYQVRDTLLGTVRKDGLKPLSYHKIAHENGKYSRDDIIYSYAGSSVGGSAKRTRQNKEGGLTVTEKNLSASGPVYDMLSVFYYLRTIDYASLKEGQVVKASVFSGKKCETITIRCVGMETIKLRDKSKKEAYHIRFKFTTDGKKKSSDDIDTWISTDDAHIPLLVIGKLPVGQVKCYYVG